VLFGLMRAEWLFASRRFAVPGPLCSSGATAIAPALLLAAWSWPASLAWLC